MAQHVTVTFGSKELTDMLQGRATLKQAGQDISPGAERKAAAMLCYGKVGSLTPYFVFSFCSSYFLVPLKENVQNALVKTLKQENLSLTFQKNMP